MTKKTTVKKKAAKKVAKKATKKVSKKATKIIAKKTTAKTSKRPLQLCLAEEGGLVTVVVNPRFAATTRKSPSPRGALVRVRMNPPEKELREDRHPFDVPRALAFADKVARAPIEKAGAVWIDTTLGIGRVTVSFVADGKDAKRIGELAANLTIAPYELEEVVHEKNAGERIRMNAEVLRIYSPTPATAASRRGKVEKALASRKVDGSFRRMTGLDKRILTLANVKRGLVWLSKTLEKLDDAVIEPLGVDASYHLVAYVNAHPRMRVFALALQGKSPDDASDLPDDIHEALLAALDIPQDEARRVAGVLWDSQTFEIRGANRVELVADS